MKPVILYESNGHIATITTRIEMAFRYGHFEELLFIRVRLASLFYRLTPYVYTLH